MKVSFSEKALDDFSRMDAKARELFWGHIHKFAAMPPRRHLRFGLPFFVENAGKQGRLVFSFYKEELIVVRCFTRHKEYEKWYKAYG